MARTGRFGRLPRQAPDLSGAIAALLREAQNQYDQNMVDAWKNGGKVDGRGVSDTRLLAHFKSRMEGLSEDDPLYDQWQNTHTQYAFAIEESKMALKNDQGKLSDAGMAAFYRKWAGKPEVQKNSEFWRSLMSRAAKWNAAAKARSSANGARAAAEAHNKWVNGYYKQHVQGAETATSYLVAIAKTYGAAPPNADSLDDIDPNSVAYGKFMDVIEDGKTDDPNVQGLVDEMNKEIQKVNPNWTFSQSNLTDLLNRGDDGLKRLVQESTTDTERKAWSGRRENLRYEKTRVKQTEANERIQIAADTYALDLDACAGDPYCARNATERFRDKLQGEVKNVVGGAGSLTATTQDVRTSSALVNTIEQLNNTLAGKENKPPAAKVGQGDDRAEGYTIFDAAGGRDTPSGWLAQTGNFINGDMDKLDRGGWMMTQPMVQDGRPVLDGHGQPMYQTIIYDVNTPPPAGAIAITGNTMVTDQTRAATGPEGPTHVTRTPTMYIQPSAPDISYVGPSGETIDPKAVGGVALKNGQMDAPDPWLELRGVKGPDGVTRTLYRTGNGVDIPFLFHTEPPVAADQRKDPQGRVVVGVTQGTDAKGNPILQSDIKDIVAGVDAARSTTRTATKDDPNPPFVLGTYSSSGATSTAQAIATGFASNNPDASKNADKYLRQFQQGIEGLPLTDPARIAGQRDYQQLSQTVDLYKQGKAGSLLDSYTEMNKRTPQDQAYVDALAKQGFGPTGYGGQAELDRRIDLLKGIDAADKRLNEKYSLAGQMAAAWTPQVGLGLGAGFAGPNPRPTGGQTFAQQQADLEAQKRNVFNPSISVSNITVPGMPQMMQPGQFNPASNGLPAQYAWMGALGGKSYTPAGYTGPTAFPAPKPVSGPNYTPPPAPKPVQGPPTPKPPPAPVPKPPGPTPGYGASGPSYAYPGAYGPAPGAYVPKYPETKYKQMEKL